MPVHLKPLSTDDLDLVRGWLFLPHVMEWWHDPAHNVAEVESMLASDHARGFIILRDDRPVGYIQAYDCHADTDDYWKDKVPQGSWGFDIFIAEPSMLRSGIALAAIAELAALLRNSFNCPQLIVDPHVDNLAAIRLYETLGFRIVATLTDHPEGGNHLMVKAVPVKILDSYPLITTTALRETRDFYLRHFDMTVLFEVNWVVMLSTGDSKICLGLMSPDHPSRPPGPEPFNGQGMIITLQVADAADSHARIKASGAEIVYDLHGEPWGQRRFMLRDPSGTLIDVVEQTEAAPGFWDKYLEGPA